MKIANFYSRCPGESPDPDAETWEFSPLIKVRRATKSSRTVTKASSQSHAPGIKIAGVPVISFLHREPSNDPSPSAPGACSYVEYEPATHQ